MDDKTTAILLGGVLPAFLFGVTGFLPKFIGKETATGPYIIAVGGAAVIVGIVFTLLERNASFTRQGLATSALIGAIWALGTGCTLAAMSHYGGNVSQLVPLYNMNTLVAVVLGLVVLSEWKTVHTGQILLAAALIVGGGVLASFSTRP